MNSRNKGARGEREAAKYLTKLGFACKRMGRNGYKDSDLKGIEEFLPNVHVEVKFGYKTMDIHTACLRKAWEQARGPMDVERFRREAESGQSCTPVVLWRPLRKPWRLTWMEPCGLVTTTGDDAIRTQLLRLNGGKEAG